MILTFAIWAVAYFLFGFIVGRRRRRPAPPPVNVAEIRMLAEDLAQMRHLYLDASSRANRVDADAAGFHKLARLLIYNPRRRTYEVEEVTLAAHNFTLPGREPAKDGGGR